MNSCEAFDQKTGKWNKITAIGNERSVYAVSVVGGKLYGFTDGGDVLTSVVEYYDPIKNSWTPTTPLPVGRWGFGKSENEDI